MVVPLVVLVAVAATTVLVSERVARANAVADAERIATRFTPAAPGTRCWPTRWPATTGRRGGARPARHESAQRRLDHLPRGLVSRRAISVFSSVESESGDHYPPRRTSARPRREKWSPRSTSRPKRPTRARSPGPMVEVYVPTTAGDETVVVEAYFSYDGIDSAGRAAARELIPLAIGALVVLQIVQLPDRDGAGPPRAPAGDRTGRARAAHPHRLGTGTPDDRCGRARRPGAGPGGRQLRPRRAARAPPRGAAQRCRPAHRGAAPRGALPPPADGRPVPARPEQCRSGRRDRGPRQPRCAPTASTSPWTSLPCRTSAGTTPP